MAAPVAKPADDAATTAEHAAAGLDTQSQEYRDASPAERAKAAELAAAVIPTESVPESLRAGYVLPPGLEFSVAEHAPLLAQARAANLPQSVIDRYIAAGM